MTSPGGGPTFTPEQYGPYIQAIQQGIDESSGYQREALKAQMSSAQAARANAMKIAQLQASTSRYGIDAQSATALRELTEKARQFDADHGLEMAKAFVQYGSSPDLMFARNDLVSALGRVGQGLQPSPMSAQGQPHAKTWEDFAAIAQYNGSTIPGAASNAASSGGGSAQPQAQTSSAGSVSDPRVSAASAIMKAAPPSASAGADENDFAALSAIRSMYEVAQPGAVAHLGPAREKIALAGMARLGYDPNLVRQEYARSLPGQKSPLLSA